MTNILIFDPNFDFLTKKSAKYFYKLRTRKRLKNCVLIKTDIFPNHWLLGGAFDAPNAHIPGLFRTWEMAIVKTGKKR